MVVSINKGKRAERDFAKLLKDELGFQDARRSQQYCGRGGDADISCPNLNIFIEVKHVEKLNIDKAMEQAVRDCKEKKIPCVAHKKNRGEWLMTFRAKDFNKLIFEASRIMDDMEQLDLTLETP